MSNSDLSKRFSFDNFLVSEKEPNTTNKPMEKKYSHQQDDKVYFDMGEGLPKGYGFVNGVIGPIIILRLAEPIKDYPFTHYYVIDKQITFAPKNIISPMEVK